MKELHTIIYMEPVAKARARTVRYNTKKGDSRITTFTPKQTGYAEAMIRTQLLDQIEPGAGRYYFPKPTPIFLEAHFYRRKPKSTAKQILLPITKPDWDNYGKLLSDALNGFIYDDDSQITTAIIKKCFVNNIPFIEIWIREDDNENKH